MYTIHAFKGLEDEYIRIHEDVHTLGDDQLNLYHVALTRGTKIIVEEQKGSPVLFPSPSFPEEEGGGKGGGVGCEGM